MIQALEKDLMVLSNKSKYITEILDNTIDLRKKKSEEVSKMLKDKSYDFVDGEYKYLTRMYMDSVTLENVEKSNKELQTKREELDKINKTTVEEFWLKELNALTSEPKKRKLIII